MTISEIIDRAVQIWTQQDTIVDLDSEEVMTAELAWGLAVEELVKTDEGAVAVLRSLFCTCNEPFAARVKQQIPNYAELETRRQALIVSAES